MLDPRIFDLGITGAEWSASRLGLCTLRDIAPGTHWIGGWFGPRTGLDNLERTETLALPGLEHPPLSSTVRRYTD
jgi:hypothetical protein